MNNIIYYRIDKIKSVKKVKGTVFNSYFDKKEYDEIMKYYLQDRSKKLYNGGNLRLDQVVHDRDGVVLELSDITFFDYMSSNILLLNKSEVLSYLITEQRLHKKVEDFFNICEDISSSNEILGTQYLANLASVSVLIEDTTGRYGIVRRGKRTAVSAGFWAVSVTGCIENCDFNNGIDAIRNCCIREVREELNIQINPYDIVIKGISFDDQKLQPIILCDVKINTSWEKILPGIRNGKEYDLEVEELIPMKNYDLAKVIQEKKITAASKVHMSTHCSGTIDDLILEKDIDVR